MKRIILLLLVLAFFVLLNCRSRDKTTVRIAGNVHSHLDELIPLFEKKHPDIKVQTVDMRYPPGSRLVNTNRTHDAYVGYLSTANSDIDVYEIDVIWLTEFVKNGWVQALDSYLAAGERKQFLEGVLEGCRIDGRVWAVQEWVDFGLMYYRKDILKGLGRKPPETWEEFMTLGGAARQRGMALLSFQGFNYEGLVCFFNELIRSFGGTVFDPRGRLQITTKEARKALTFLVGMNNRGLLPRQINNYTEESSHKDFLGGKSLFCRNWPYVYHIADQPEWKMRENIGIIPIPRGRGQTRHYGTTGGWMLVMSKYSRYRDESWKLMQFLTSEAIQRHLFEKHGLVPTRKILFEEYAPKKLPGLEKYVAGREYLSPRPMDQNYREISRILSQKIWEALTYPEIKDVKTQLELAEKEINTILFRKSRLLQKEMQRNKE